MSFYRFCQPLAIAAAFVTMAGAALAQAAHFVTPDGVGTGALLFKTNEPGQYIEAPALATDFEVTVTGPIIRARVTQRFENPADGWVEGVYVFPLPEGSAVDTLKMVVGDRIVIGDIREKQDAKRIYEEAKARGQKAALLEKNRPNIFTNAVANIGPHETVVIQMEYQDKVAVSGSSASLRLPLVVAPRYNPSPEAVIGPSAERVALRDPVPDREAISPPVLDPRMNPDVNPVTLTIHLNPGYALGEVTSPYYQTIVQDVSDNRKTLTFKEGAVPAKRDFVLQWKQRAVRDPSVSLFRETVGRETYLLSYIAPPDAASNHGRQPREVIFVIDNSGSMGGTSINQAKASLIYALGRLNSADSFNVIRFDDTMSLVFPKAVPASPDNIALAKHYVGGLEAAGGTEMIPPLRAALEDPNNMDATAVRQVIFLTDGAIGNEQQMFDTLSARLGRSRVFMVGIGSAPNSYLMTRAAELGRGSFTHIGSGEEVEDRMRELFGKLEAPVATGLTATLHGAAELTPNPLPDLYRGEPLVLLARLDGEAQKLTVRGEIDGKTWSRTIGLSHAVQGTGIGKLWARHKIADFEVAASLGTLPQDQADKQRLALSLEHHMVSRMASLVAVDKTPARPAGQPLARADIPLNLPYGWDFDKVFGERPQTKHASGDARLIAISSRPMTAANGMDRVQLPQTATSSRLLILLGVALLLLGSSLSWRVLRRQA